MEETNKEKTQYLLTVLTKADRDADKAKEILLREGASVSLTEPLGQRELAHSVAGCHQLFLTSFTFTVAPESLKKIDEELRQETEICRFLLTRWRLTPEDKKSAGKKKKEKKEEDV